MTKKVQFPEWITNKPLKKLIRKLLRKNPEKRKKILWDDIKQNEVFKGIKWVPLFSFY